MHYDGGFTGPLGLILCSASFALGLILRSISKDSYIPDVVIDTLQGLAFLGTIIVAIINLMKFFGLDPSIRSKFKKPKKHK